MRVPQEILDRFRRFNERSGARFVSKLGDGVHGYVFATSLGSAQKIFAHPEGYRRERDVYLRLRHHAVESINDLNVPQFERADDGLMAIEMSIVNPPWILDFASARLDFPEALGEEALEDAAATIHERFGDRAGEVFLLLDRLQRELGIWYYDARPDNIRFDDP